MAEDLFELFNIPLDCNDASAIEQAIEKKRREISSKTNNARGEGLVNKDVLERLPQLRKILLDDEQRQAHRLAVTKHRQEQQEKRLENASKMIALFNNRQSITKAEYDVFINEYAHPQGPNKSELTQMIKVPINDKAPDTSSEELQPLSHSEEKQISNWLKIVQKRDLYDFLQVSFDCSHVEIKQRIKNARDAWSGKATAQKAAAHSLIGKAETILLDAHKKESYKATLDLEKIEDFKQQVKVFIADGTLSQDEIQSLLQGSEISHKKALSIIKKQIGASGKAIEVPAGFEKLFDDRRCGYCGAYSPKQAKVCNGCNKPLDVVCPKCSKRYPSEEGICPSCNLTLSDAIKIQADTETIKLVYSAGDTQESQRLLNLAKTNFPTSKQILELDAEIRRQINANLDLLVEIKNLMTEHKLNKAQQKLNEFRAKFPNNEESVKINSQLQEDLSAVRSLLEKAKQSSGDRAAQLCVQAAELCVDSEDIAREARKYPPSAPREFSALQKNDMIVLEWSPSISQKVTSYVVERKLGSIPNSTKDSDFLQEVNGLRFEDQNAPIGKVCYYAVFAKRAGVESREGASSQPVVRTYPVTEIKVEPQDGLVKLSYKLPETAHGIAVYRSENSNIAKLDQRLKLNAGRDRLVDSNVENGITYNYTILAEFSTPQGIISSRQVSANATPQKLPPAVKNLQANFVNRQVVLNWPADKDQKVVIVRNDKPISIEAGVSISPSGLNDIGQVLQVPLPGKLVDRPPKNGEYCYTAVTLSSSIAVIGATSSVACVADVSNLKLENRAGVLVAEWQWPQSSNRTLLVCKKNANPDGSNDNEAHKQWCTKEEYLKNGGLLLEGLPPGQYHIVAYAAYQLGTKELISAGTSETCKTIGHSGDMPVISYKIKQPFFGRSYKLIINTSIDSLALPNLSLVSKQGYAPIDLSDGALLKTISGLHAENGKVEIPLENPPKNQVAKLFFEDSDDYRQVTLKHPPVESLRLKK